ncbi:hypothetical protein VNO77_43630 [Canavalia gladiata]|uniref:Uncharacterized protein n=1 Tax=Canavalia gladiata TaxID=3824 RepID=A0AAN9PN30_CANGL
MSRRTNRPSAGISPNDWFIIERKNSGVIFHWVCSELGLLPETRYTYALNSVARRRPHLTQYLLIGVD